MSLFITGHDTGPGEISKKYRPLFLDHFDKKEAEVKVNDKNKNTHVHSISP